MKRLAAAVLSLGLLAGGPALADSDGQVQHYKAKPAPNLEVAVKNLREYNQKLDELLSQEMTVENMEKIHQLSYTLENALQRVDKDLKNIASVLEGMHLASEKRNEKAVKDNAETYLENTNMILGQN
ncbi:DUF6746 family protein [Rhodovibrio salinarum]|uniref:Uncharacterized protein n=1 Tax=Rhodovibrio salinarum TaxID=1087 RepID=A0A934QIX0_9PROT|nr:DUF6746 family protein [Rhodovibrio salinarum]MBK1697638.1 hypothetical protein [Rhodovibrio salinarum]